MAITAGHDVASPVMEFRTPAEVAALRASAMARVTSSPYMAKRCTAVMTTLDWIAGTGPAPATGRTIAADEDSIADERLLAQDLERARVGGGGHVAPGVVAQTLRWYQRLGQTEAPVL